MPEQNVNSTFGSLFLGGVVTAIFYGITCLQTFIYLQYNSKNDTHKFKLFITFLWGLQTAHLAFVVHCLYIYLVTSHGTPFFTVKPMWSLSAQVFFPCVGIFLVQIFFMLRIWHLCKQQKKVLFLIAIIFIFALYSMVIGFVYAAKVTMFTLSYDISKEAIIPESYETDKAAPLLYSGLATLAAADISIAASLCILLFRNKTGFNSQTDSLVTLLITSVTSTGLLTSLVAGACFITYLIWPHNFVFMGIFFVLGTAYYNSLLASLNARPALREKLNADLLILSPEISERFVAHRDTSSEVVDTVETR
ncbi:hypothetical protein BDQ17DRAFT_754322 [Cyathus striatus]|nr:hypothetical protein BDQ17DRAFT_754322 [Cyathus striatus]